MLCVGRCVGEKTFFAPPHICLSHFLFVSVSGSKFCPGHIFVTDLFISLSQIFCCPIFVVSNLSCFVSCCCTARIFISIGEGSATHDRGHGGGEGVPDMLGCQDRRSDIATGSDNKFAGVFVLSLVFVPVRLFRVPVTWPLQRRRWST